MFVGLLIVVAGPEKTVISPNVSELVGALHLDKAVWLSVITAVLANIVSNVPAVLVLKPFVAQLHDPQRAWLVVAMSSTLAGNFTLLGSGANLIVAEQAKAAGKELSFSAFFKVGVPLTLVTLAAGTAWLAFTA